MEAVVLDSSVIVKALVKPGRWLPADVYCREIETHVKARRVVEILGQRRSRVLIPYPVLVEVAAVVSRLVSRELAEKTIDSLRSTENYVIIDEEDVREEALEIAINTGSSGFDAYILATARKHNAILITDDEPMSIHANQQNIKCILLRKTPINEIEKQIHPQRENYS